MCSTLLLIFSILLCSSWSPVQSFTAEELIYDAGELSIVRGNQVLTTKSRRPYVELLGIPFAEPVTAEKRFLPPTEKVLPLVPEGEIFSATRKAACCPQPSSNLLCAFNQKDDCLGMNIYTPLVQNETGEFDRLLPVIVFIHGGAFILGSGDAYSGARLLEEDVVLVNFNYRLGLFGFFTLNNDDAPGNAAMYDMVEALKFVKKHIHHFGGDPNLITIAGQSAGSVAVTHLMLSPMSREEGLFHRAIAMSGSALLTWGTITSEEAVEASLQLAQMVECYDGNGDTQGVADCMRQKPTRELVTALDNYQRAEKNKGRLGFAPAAPTIQTNIARGRAFLNESPIRILERQDQSNVPLMMGSVKHDGSFVLGVIYNQFLKFNGLEENAEFLKTEFVPKCLNALGIEDDEQVEAIAETFLGDAKNSGNLTQMLPGLTDLHTVYYFKEDSLKTLAMHSQMQPQSYWYEFDFAGKRSVYSVLVNTQGNPVKGGICHGDDMIYLFNVPLMSLTTPEEQAVSDRTVKYVVNFAATGNPNVGSRENYLENINTNEWAAYSEDAPAYVKIDAEDKFMAEHPRGHWVGPAMELYPELDEPGTTTTPSSTTTTPGNGDTTTPSNGGTTPPGNGETTTPGNGGTTPPGNGGTTPPGSGETTPPGNGGTTPPGNGGTTPPGNGGTTPPGNGGTTPPGNGGTTPPGNGGTTPPGEGGSEPETTPDDAPVSHSSSMFLLVISFVFMLITR